MFIVELFTQSLPWDFKIRKNGEPAAWFEVYDEKADINRKYVVDFSKWIDNHESPPFQLGGPHETFNGVWEISFAIETYQGNQVDRITGSGNAIAVFSTVIDIIETMVSNHSIENIYFTSETSEPSRIKLYDRMAKHFSNKAGWRYIDHKELVSRSTDGDDNRFIRHYLLTKQPHPHSLIKGTKHD